MKLVVALLLVMLALPVVVAAQGLPGPVPAPITVRNEITVQAPPPDPKIVAQSAEESSKAIIISVIAPTPLMWAHNLLDLPDLWRTTPPGLTYNNEVLRALADAIRLASFALIALAIFAMGASHALGGGLPLEWGRLLFAVALSLGNLVWWQIGIDINNAINSAISAPELPSLVRPHLQMPPNPAEALSSVLLVIVYAIVAILTLFSLVTRLGLIDILIAVGSLALLCYATAQTEHFANGYSRISTGLVFSQVLIVLGLKVATVISSLGTGVGGALLGIVVLLLVRSLPGMLAGMGRTGSGDTGILGRLVQVVILRRLAAR